MAEKSGSGPKPSNNPVVKTIKTMAFIAAILYVGQIVLNKPERRPAVACTPIYQAGHFFWLGGYKIFAPTDHITHIRISRSLLGFQRDCVESLSETGFLDLWGWHL